MMASFAFTQLFTIDSKQHITVREHNNSRFVERRGGGRGVIPIYVAGASSGRHGKHSHSLGNRPNNYIEFIIIGVSISIALLCRFI
uniref:Uncharacterized protein n=1 Tax=Cucumis sativus TaxID=3659 RepID=A0A0A0KTE6_CUCSA